MNGALFRLFVRKNVVWDLLVLAVLARILSVVCGGVEAILHGDATVGEAVYESGASLRIHLALLAGWVVGVVANFSLQDLAYCRFSWVLPGLGRSLRRELALLAALSVLASAAGFALFDSSPGSLGWFGPAMLTLLGFGLGSLLWDFHAGKLACSLAQLALVVLLCAARSIAGWLDQAPYLALPFALIVGSYAIGRSTSIRAMRARALVPRSRLGSSFREPASVAPYKADKLGRVRGWTRGRIAGLSVWARALLFEDAGWARGSWAWRSLRLTSLVVLVTVALAFGLGVRSSGSVRNGLAWVAQATIDPTLRLEGVWSGPPSIIVSLGFSTAVFMIVLAGRQDLRRGVIYPLSRRDRAEVVWRAGLVQGLVAVTGTAIAFALIGALCLLASGLALPIRQVPEVFTVLALTAVMLPALQWMRLRYLEGAGERWSPTAYGAVVGITAAMFTGLHASALEALRLAGPTLIAVLTFLVLPAGFLLAQQLYRRGVRGWVARMDLA